MSVEVAAPAERGITDVAPRVVEKLAVRAAFEVEGVGPAPVTGLPTRRSQRVTARVDGNQVDVELEVAIQYPLPIADTADQVRARIRERIDTLAGMEVGRIGITVAFLLTPADQPRAFGVV